jgi:transcriptional regulator with XRE-family HTH domain
MPPSPVPEPLGRRVASHRARLGLTQHDVAARLALSRNAVSHIETGDSIPTERTIVLLAGLFGVEPHELVAGTDFPAAKADRLPLVAPRHTRAETRLQALALELRWVDQLDDRRRAEALATIDRELRTLDLETLDQRERALVREARAQVAGRATPARRTNTA